MNCLKNNFRIYIKIDIKTAPTCFGVIAIVRERTIVRRKFLRMKTFVLFSPFCTLRRNKSIALVKIGIRHCLSHTYGAS